MMKLRQLMLAGLTAAALVPGIASGQTIADRVNKVEDQLEQQRKDLASALGIEMHALVSTVYTYGFNNPDSDFLTGRTFDTNHNNIDLNQASLFFSRQKEDEAVGFRLVLDFGEVAKSVGSVSCWDGDCNSSEQDNAVELREAFLTYKAPIGDGVTFKAGRFSTLAGYEILPNYNAFNPHISNSVMFGYFLPFTHTGLLMSFPIDIVTIDLGVVNGWDDLVDRNDGKSVHGGIGVKPMDTLSMYLSGTYGTERGDEEPFGASYGKPGNSKRGLATFNTSFQAIEQLTLALDINYGHEENALSSRSVSSTPPRPSLCTECRNAKWYGGALYAMINITDMVSLNVRGEWIDDRDAVRLFGAAGSNGGTLWDGTITLGCKVTDNLLARVEYRHDQANDEIYGKRDHSQSTQDTIATQLVYAF